ncbi:hypothetical protein, partial [Enterococcus faecalis]|uniref:hypothetical protein n=1 Tax=Enterococcus faecalis TaxID=1351 RepID=UPI002FBD6193
LIWGTTLLTPKSVVHAESQITEITFQVLDPEPESPSTPTKKLVPTPPLVPTPQENGSGKQPGGGAGQFVNNGQNTSSSIGLPIAAATVASWEKLADRANALNQAIANT